jgi:hypothetical protein
MKKNLIITIALGLFLVSCKKSELLPEPQVNTSVSMLTTQLTPPESTCKGYSIFNPHGPSGATVLFTYKDCDGQTQTGSVDPLQTVFIKAQPGTVKCPGGLVTEL